MATNETLDGLKPTQRKPHQPERKCILSGAVQPRELLIRLALGPDGQVLPDVRAKAPGRGAWIGVGSETLDAALSKGQLRGALSRAFKTGDLTIADDLVARTMQALRQNALDRLGLESRGGRLITGSDRIKKAARAGKVHLLIHASDSAEDGRRKLDQAQRVGQDAVGSGEQGLVIPADRTMLAAALGRENTVHIAIVDERAAKRVSSAISRWMNFVTPSEKTEPCEADSQDTLGSDEKDKGLE